MGWPYIRVTNSIEILRLGPGKNWPLSSKNLLSVALKSGFHCTWQILLSGLIKRRKFCARLKSNCISPSCFATFRWQMRYWKVPRWWIQQLPTDQSYQDNLTVQGVCMYDLVLSTAMRAARQRARSHSHLNLSISVLETLLTLQEHQSELAWQKKEDFLRHLSRWGLRRLSSISDSSLPSQWSTVLPIMCRASDVTMGDTSGTLGNATETGTA